MLPPSVDENGYGLRVPGSSSAHTRAPGSSTTRQLSHDAYLKFIEDDFLASQRLNPATDGRPDKRPDVREEAPGLGSLAADFNFNQSPRAPLVLASDPQPGPASQPPGSQKPPALESVPASVTGTSAKLNASVNPDGAALSACRFEYGTSLSYGSSAPCQPMPGSASSPVEVSATVGPLLKNQAYHFRIVAANTAGTSYGPDLQFTSDAAPTAETEQASSVSRSSAVLNASVNPNGVEVSDCHFEYGFTSSYGTSVACSPSPGAGMSPVSVSADAGELSAQRTYHFRIVAANADGTSYGADGIFGTLPYAPSATTEPASAITSRKAQLNATVNPEGAEVSECRFEYGTSASYGSSVPCSSLPGSGTSAVEVSAVLSGLAAKSNYHFRILATNAVGTSYGADQTFKT